MKLLTILACLAAPAAAWAQDAQRMARGPQDLERERPQEEEAPAAMEYIYRYSNLDAGVLLTDWDSALDLESDVGFYVRWNVGLASAFSATLAYRHYDFENSELPGRDEEDLLLRAVLIGVGWNHPLTPEFVFEAHGGIGPMWWDSQGAGQSNDSGPLISLEGALTVRLHEMMRLRLGVVADIASTEFHNDSSEVMVSLSALFGFELGF